MRPFSLLVKPTSADCNLACDYCFYLPKKNLYPQTKTHRMSDAVLERLIKSYMHTAQPAYSICWQGGEPTLMGTNFFLKAVEFEKKYGSPGARMGNSIQTNATLITDKMAKLFAKYNFLVGCSLDGPENIHDHYRQTLNGKATHKEVLKGIEMLKRNRVAFNILTLVSQANINHAKEVFHYLKNMGFNYHQYIPCIEFDENKTLLPFSITGELWGDFLCDIFDAWYPKQISSVSVRNFDAILSKQINGINDVCVLGDNCCQYFVVEYNGDVYPCDFFVEKKHKLGNIMETTWEELLYSPAYQQFGAQKSCWNETCNTCDHQKLCAGDCLKNRVYSGNPPENLSCLCPGLTSFFIHTKNGFEKLSDKIQREKKKAHKRIDKTPKSGRNDPCICGSGLKFKKCCGK